MMELFTGCGGLAKGMEKAGFSHVAFVEKNHFACESLRQNFSPEIVHETDIRSFDFTAIGKVDAIAGGPPCQPFSLGGLAKAYDDHRDMFPEAARAISELSPKGFVFENVKGLLRKGFSQYFEYILLRLSYPNFHKLPEEEWGTHLERLRGVTFQNYEDLKYRVQFKLLNAADYGVPQVRERVFIVGIRSDIPAVWTWPQPTCSKSEWQTIDDALQGISDPRNSSNRISDHIFIGGARQYPGHTGSPIEKPSKTIKAGAHGVPGGENMILYKDGRVRYLTVYEAKTLQTFPRNFKIIGPWGEAMRQIGNAVPVKLAEIIGRRFRQVLLTEIGEPIKFNTDTCGNLMIVEKTTTTKRTKTAKTSKKNSSRPQILVSKQTKIYDTK